MAMTSIPPFGVTDPSQVGEVRRAATTLASKLGYDDNDAARVALVATEMASNLVKHGREGSVLLQAWTRPPIPTIELIAIDRGPGIANVTAAMRDGMSTAGSPGTGLGAISRVADHFDLFSTGAGTVVYAAVLRAGAPLPETGFVVGGVLVPFPGEEECGDGFQVERVPGRAMVMVTDGLGHGPQAAAATRCAAEIFALHHALGPVDLMQRLHDGMKATRGAAAALAEVDARRGVVRYCGVGNIAGTLLLDGASRSLVSHYGTLGHDARKIAQFEYPWSPESVLVLNSDGLVSSWTLERYPGILRRAPALTAAVLYRDCRRQRDDAGVVVLRGQV